VPSLAAVPGIVSHRWGIRPAGQFECDATCNLFKTRPAAFRPDSSAQVLQRGRPAAARPTKPCFPSPRVTFEYFVHPLVSPRRTSATSSLPTILPRHDTATVPTTQNGRGASSPHPTGRSVVDCRSPGPFVSNPAPPAKKIAPRVRLACVHRFERSSRLLKRRQPGSRQLRR
jgi:hypothetical protein